MDDRDLMCKTIREMSPGAWGAFSDFLRQHGFVTVAPEEPKKEPRTRTTKEDKAMLRDFETRGGVSHERR